MAKKSGTSKLLIIGGIAVAAYFFFIKPAAASPGGAAALATTSEDSNKVQAWIAGEPNPINQAVMQTYVTTLDAADLHRLAVYYDYIKSGYNGVLPADVANYIQNVTALGVGFHA
jgi:hypothetical protein